MDSFSFVALGGAICAVVALTAMNANAAREATEPAGASGGGAPGDQDQGGAGSQAGSGAEPGGSQGGPGAAGVGALGEGASTGVPAVRAPGGLGASPVRPERAQDALRRMKEILGRALDLAREAREQQDVVKLNCVNEKLTSVKGLLRIAEQANIGMQEALARTDTDSAQHEFTKVMIALERAEHLRAETEGCVGAEAAYTGETDLKVEEEEAATGSASRPGVDPAKDAGAPGGKVAEAPAAEAPPEPGEPSTSPVGDLTRQVEIPPARAPVSGFS